MDNCNGSGPDGPWGPAPGAPSVVDDRSGPATDEADAATSRAGRGVSEPAVAADEGAPRADGPTTGIPAARPSTPEADALAAKLEAEAARPKASRAPREARAKAERAARLRDSGYRGRKPREISESLGGLRPLWEGWLYLGEMSMLRSGPKVGKTRICMTIARDLYGRDAWGDGAPNPYRGGRTLVLPYDKNVAELDEELMKLGVQDAVTIPTDPDDEAGLRVPDLDDPRLIDLLDYLIEQDPAHRLIVVDTLTYGAHLSLGKPEDMKRMLDPIMDLAARRSVALLVLIHENRQGGALGRRITERARVLWSLKRRGEEDRSRLRLAVEESNFKARPALDVEHAEAGVVFSPVGREARPAHEADACARWIVDRLRRARRPVGWVELADAAGAAGLIGRVGPDGRWTDRRKIDRAIARVNAPAPSLVDLGVVVEVEKRREPGRTRALSVYSLRDLGGDEPPSGPADPACEAGAGGLPEEPT
ncbi:AAA family ATPase [Paludisphaera soli]|uniref:AAA family ATPase n=1 Tax=Paludisphaera soli TaxID=2712865 RepID=UPI0013ECC3E8|nr:AAA family ATPase [Paludisphaera soli]